MAEITTEEVRYPGVSSPGGNRTLNAYVAHPPSEVTPPVVIVVQEW